MRIARVPPEGQRRRTPLSAEGWLQRHNRCGPSVRRSLGNSCLTTTRATPAGSVVIPRRRSGRGAISTCVRRAGATFHSERELEQHVRGHVVPHPVLVARTSAVAKRFTITSRAILDDLRTSNTLTLAIDGHSLAPGELHGTLLQKNGESEFDLVLVGAHEHVRNAYRLRVAIFNDERLSDIEAAFLDRLNHTNQAIPTSRASCAHGATRPNDRTRQALANFRLAMIMRDHPLAGDSDRFHDYRHRVRTQGKPYNRYRAR